MDNKTTPKIILPSSAADYFLNPEHEAIFTPVVEAKSFTIIPKTDDAGFISSSANWVKKHFYRAVDVVIPQVDSNAKQAIQTIDGANQFLAQHNYFTQENKDYIIHITKANNYQAVKNVLANVAAPFTYTSDVVKNIIAGENISTTTKDMRQFQEMNRFGSAAYWDEKIVNMNPDQISRMEKPLESLKNISKSAPLEYVYLHELSHTHDPFIRDGKKPDLDYHPFAEEKPIKTLTLTQREMTSTIKKYQNSIPFSEGDGAAFSATQNFREHYADAKSTIMMVQKYPNNSNEIFDGILNFRENNAPSHDTRKTIHLIKDMFESNPDNLLLIKGEKELHHYAENIAKTGLLQTVKQKLSPSAKMDVGHTAMQSGTLKAIKSNYENASEFLDDATNSQKKYMRKMNVDENTIEKSLTKKIEPKKELPKGVIREVELNPAIAEQAQETSRMATLQKLGKGIGTQIAKKAPGIGLALSLADAKEAYAKDDYIGAGLSTLEGATSVVPGVGTLVSTGVSAVNIAYQNINLNDIIGLRENDHKPKQGMKND